MTASNWRPLCSRKIERVCLVRGQDFERGMVGRIALPVPQSALFLHMKGFLMNGCAAVVVVQVRLLCWNKIIYKGSISSATGGG